MLRYYQAVRQTAEHIANAINTAVDALHEGRIEQEPAMTDRMLGAIEQSLSGFSAKGIRWGAHTLSDRGAHSSESIYGADFMGVLNIDLPEFKVKKGFLAQAKLLRNESSGSLNQLHAQCEKMLLLSPASFVFLYGDEGVNIVPALSVVSSRIHPAYLYRRSAQRFFEEHLECFIGDRAIQAPVKETLTNLRQFKLARTGIEIRATAEDYDTSAQPAFI